MISAKLLHVVLHRLQLILSYIELAEQVDENPKRKEFFDRSRDEIESLKKLLVKKRREDP
jgi:two-component sensor histidine kinase